MSPDMTHYCHRGCPGMILSYLSSFHLIFKCFKGKLLLYLSSYARAFSMCQNLESTSSHIADTQKCFLNKQCGQSPLPSLETIFPSILPVGPPFFSSGKSFFLHGWFWILKVLTLLTQLPVQTLYSCYQLVEYLF